MRGTFVKVSGLLASLVVLGAAVSVTLPAPASAASICATPCTLFDSTVPPIPDSGPDSAVELGVKFKADVPGSVTGIRFYKSAANTGTHTGTLWTSTGTPLATAIFTSETASGWQEVSFASPVVITAGTTYVASYHTDVGHYADTMNGFTAAFDNPPLHALADVPSGGNGVFFYGAGGIFPSNTFNASNYWVDVTFATPSCTTTCYVNGTTGNDGNDGQTASTALQTVNAALAAVSPGGTIIVAAGTYTEQIVISKAVTITGAGQATTTIQGPAALANSSCIPLTSGQPTRAVVTVCGSPGSTVVMSGLTISGGVAGEDASASCAPLITGAWVSDGETLNISQSTVKNVYNAAGPGLWGCQQGAGIRAGSKALGLVGNLIADHLTVLKYQKTGIIVDGPGSTGMITQSLVEGDQLATLSQFIAMNGIQISRGASGVVDANTVSGNKCDDAVAVPPCGVADPLHSTQSAGILLFDPFSGQIPVPTISVTNNIVTDNDMGIYTTQLTGTPTLSGNTVNANRYEGIFLDEGTALVTSNTITNNGTVPFGTGIFAVQGFGSQADTTATVTLNHINSNPTGVEITDVCPGLCPFPPGNLNTTDAFTTHLTINRNDLAANPTHSIDNQAVSTTDGTCNWWGQASGPAAGQSNGSVTTSPWLLAPTPLATAPCGVGPPPPPPPPPPPSVTATFLSTSLSGGGKSGAKITAAPGTPVTDTGTLFGANFGNAGGTVTFAVYSDASCSSLVSSGGTKTVTAGSVPTSDPVTLNTPGPYYWLATYSGDSLHGASASSCGDEVETVIGHPLDHFLCYSATSGTGSTPGFTVPSPVQLINQFSPDGYTPKIGALDLHCNPVQKTVPTGVTRVTNPNAHLLCWNVSGPPTARTVIMSNQFGRATLKTDAPRQLCLPSWASSKAPPMNASAAPPGLSHFTCYSVAYAPGTTLFKPPTSVLLNDQFSGRSVRVKVGAPKLLCLPTTKIVNGATNKALNPQAHLLCYAVNPTPTKTPVYDQNQFGNGTVQIHKTGLLCLPSTKVAVGPAG